MELSNKLNSLGVIGCGKLANAIIHGLIQSQLLKECDVYVSVKSMTSHDQLKKIHPEWNIYTSNEKVLEHCDIILLAVKPHHLGDIFNSSIMDTHFHGKLILSVLAGVSISQLQNYLPHSRIIRIIPNLPCQIQAGMSVLCSSITTLAGDISLAMRIFQCTGQCLVLDEKHFDVATALCGSGPAFFVLIVEALADGGVLMGLPKSIALQLITQTMYGTAKMIQESPIYPTLLKDQVATPNGCTVHGLFTMEQAGLRGILMKTIQSCTQRVTELGYKE